MKYKLWFLHPFLFAFAPAIFMWEYNFAETATPEVVPVLAIFAVFCIIVFTAFQLFYRDSQKSAIMTSIFLLLALSHKYVYFSRTSSLIRQRYAFVISAIILL